MNEYSPSAGYDLLFLIPRLSSVAEGKVQDTVSMLHPKMIVILFSWADASENGSLLNNEEWNSLYHELGD